MDTSGLAFTEDRSPGHGQAVRFWPLGLVDRDPHAPGIRGRFEAGNFLEDGNSTSWNAGDVYVWQAVDQSAEQPCLSAIQQALQSLEVAARLCRESSLGVPLSRLLDEAVRVAGRARNEITGSR